MSYDDPCKLRQRTNFGNHWKNDHTFEDFFLEVEHSKMAVFLLPQFTHIFSVQGTVTDRIIENKKWEKRTGSARPFACGKKNIKVGFNGRVPG